MRRSILFWLLATVVLISAQPALPQHPTKIPRIGYLAVGGSPDSSRRNAFQQGLRDLGYVEGKNIIIEWRGAKGKIDRLDELAAELVHLKLDVLVTTGNAATRAAKKATGTIPIVTAIVSNPVENGFVASLARPGGNTLRA